MACGLKYCRGWSILSILCVIVYSLMSLFITFFTLLFPFSLPSCLHFLPYVLNDSQCSLPCPYSLPRVSAGIDIHAFSHFGSKWATLCWPQESALIHKEGLYEDETEAAGEEDTEGSQRQLGNYPPDGLFKPESSKRTRRVSLAIIIVLCDNGVTSSPSVGTSPSGVLLARSRW